MKTLAVLTISLLMSVPAFAGSNGNCNKNVHGDRFKTNNRQNVVASALNIQQPIKRNTRRTKGRQ